MLPCIRVNQSAAISACYPAIGSPAAPTVCLSKHHKNSTPTRVSTATYSLLRFPRHLYDLQLLHRVITSAEPSLGRWGWVGKRSLLSLKWGEYTVLSRVSRFEAGQARAWCVQLTGSSSRSLRGLTSPCYPAFHGLLVYHQAPRRRLKEVQGRCRTLNLDGF